MIIRGGLDQHIVLGQPGMRVMSRTVAGAAAIEFLLRDDFTTNEAAPVTSPRTCEPGPGTLTFNQTEDLYSISGATVVPAGSAGAEPTFVLISADGQHRLTRIENFTTGRRLDFNYILSPGETLLVDVPTRRVVSVFLGDVTAQAVGRGADWSALALRGGDNLILLHMESDDYADVSAFVRLPLRHWSIDGVV